MIRAVLLTLAMALPLEAQELAPETSKLPKVSDALTEADAPSSPSTENSASESGDVAPGMRDQLRVSDQEYAGCLADLDELGVQYTEVAPIIPDDDKDCGVLRPLTITHVASDIEILPPATVRCDTARALGRWTQDFVLPASTRLSARGELTAMENGSGYVCRRRNNLPDGKLSEHAFGNAFDLMAFRFADGSRIAVQPREADGSMEEAFQDATRGSACLEFSTVLGPGSNASHADHLHFDIIARNNGFRLCEQGGVDPE